MTKNQKILSVTQKTIKYFVLILPLLLALILLNLALSLEQIPNYKSPLDKLFQAGLWFVVATSIVSIFVEIQNDITIKDLKSAQNKKINDLERSFNEKIDSLDSKLSKIINEHEDKLHDSETMIEILTQLELLKSELAKEHRIDKK